MKEGKRYSFEADFFSFGVIVHEMMFGSLPSFPLQQQEQGSKKIPAWIGGFLEQDPNRRTNPFGTNITLNMIKVFPLPSPFFHKVGEFRKFEKWEMEQESLPPSQHGEQQGGGGGKEKVFEK